MLAKFSTFRGKRTSNSQKEKQQHYERHNSHQILTTEADCSKSNVSYFSSESFLAGKTVYDKPYVESAIAEYHNNSFPSTPTSNEDSSSDYFNVYSIYDDKESLTTSSTIYEEISIVPSTLLPYEDAEEKFLDDYESYFLHLSVDNVRKDEYPELEFKRIVYLDYSTCPLYSKVQVEKHLKFMLEEGGSFFGLRFPIDKQSVVNNPFIDSTYKRILNLLSTTHDEYSIIFIPGLSSCYNLFGEMYHLQGGSFLLASHDHHNSIKHIVDAAANSNVKFGSIPLKKKDLCIHGDDMHRLLRKRGGSVHGHGLFVYSAQSFLTGMRHSLNWIVSAQQNGWKVLLDVSSCLPMVNVDLSLYQPEFVIGSLHHMTGYPLDVSFLLVRRSSHSICMKKGFGLSLAARPDKGKAVHVAMDGERLSIHAFAAFRSGLEHLEDIGIFAIQRRVESLIAWLVKTLSSLKHKLGGKPLLQLYGTLDAKQRGSILAFNVLDSTGNIFPARLVRQLAERSNIFLDTGSLFNLSMIQLLQLKSSRKQMETSSSISTQCDIQVVRISLGPVSTFNDAYKLVQFISRFRDEDFMSSEAAVYVEELEREC